MALNKKLSGDTNEFAFQMTFDADPHGGQGASEEESASWGSFQIWAKGRNLCAHCDAGEYTESVHWYMLPLLEWLIENWNWLLHEGKTPQKPSGERGWSFLQNAFQRDLPLEQEEHVHAWWKRHGLLSCREGGLFPDIVIRRAGPHVELSWGRNRLPGMPDDFEFHHGTYEQACLIDPRPMGDAIFTVVSDALGYLARKCPDSQRVRHLRTELDGLAQSQQRTVRLAILAGLGSSLEAMVNRWKNVADTIRDRMGAAADELLRPREGELAVTGACEAALMFGSVSPALSESDEVLLADKLAHYYGEGQEPEAIHRCMRDRPQLTDREPWEEGYALAEWLLETIPDALGEGGFVDVEALVRTFEITLEDIELDDRLLRGVAIAGRDHTPAILLNAAHDANSYPSGRRFCLAHELFHVLFDRNQGVSLALASGPWAPSHVEKRANAFAAMLLMPEYLIQRHAAALGLDMGDLVPANVAALAQALQVSYTSLVRHLRNRRVLGEDEMGELLERGGSPDTP